ncbi:hypothetical protein L1987_33162 [Smallanthus sonchifolius]|uniref:Uncharacterized protein n=1 Tax=Smallanthus sonchifolius TaxID=185202 RepID=A0ACB9HRG6_9ASTR|nr:hypothetical protein L1987_33162 [Smallanthus sonchifolius]
MVVFKRLDRRYGQGDRPANQQYSFLISNAVGTPGYLDPEYLEKYYLTKESDVYSFEMIALQIQASYDAPMEYEEMINTTVPRLIYESQEELNTLISKGVLLNMGKTWFSLNKNGEHCETISAAECMVPFSNIDSKDRYSHEYNSR